MSRKCLVCGVDISHKDGKAKFCTPEHSTKYFNEKKRLKKLEEKKGRSCKKCGRDISEMRSNAEFCCREHKTRYYRDQNPEKVKQWRKDNQKKHLRKILDRRLIKAQKERDELGYSKNYLRTYAQRHINDLRAIKEEKCCECGSRQFLGIHHIKYTKNPEDWEFICHSCHMKHHNPRKH